MMPGAVLWLIATAGFYVQGGHWLAMPYESLAACEADRPRIERIARERGWDGVFTKCNEVKREENKL